MGIEFEIVDHTKEVEQATDEAILKALSICGGIAESDVKENAPVIDGGLRGSITFAVDEAEKECYVGSNIEYAPYVEYGTGVYSEKGGRRGGYWVYVKGQLYSGHKTHKSYTFEEAQQIVAMLRAKGLDAHMTQGRKATHFMRDALVEHQEDYKNVLSNVLRDEMNK